MRNIKNITLLLLTLLLLYGCKHPKTDTEGPAQKKATQVPELPFLLEGDYTPDIGVTYKVIIGDDTCFVVIDSMTSEQMYGHYYQLQSGSDCVERKEFRKDLHWKQQRQDALVYIYQAPEYHQADDSAYRYPRHAINVTHDVEYGQALGYWSSMPNTEDESYLEILSEGLKNSILKTTQTLTMDIYRPSDSNDSQPRPLMMLMHGGGFYVGDKQDSLITRLCTHFARLGYVTVSINYRLGFLPTKGEIARTGYMALQDAHAAMRYLVEHATTYGIDTSLIFVGGASAGSITALNLAFMRDKDRPKAVYSSRLRDMGTIASSGNSSAATFHIKAVANMWGAITNLNMLKNSHTDIISFHGDADQVVPYDNGYPFNDISAKLGQRMFDRMYGSVQIDKRARELGLRSVFYPFSSQGHSLHHYSDGSWNQQNFEFIRNKMTEFFHEEIVGKQPTIEDDRNDTRHYLVAGDHLSNISWKVEGGFITKLSADGSEIWVVWDNQSKKQQLRVSGLNARRYGFEVTKTINTNNND
jgi:acetyl esterase/lipase